MKSGRSGRDSEGNLSIDDRNFKVSSLYSDSRMNVGLKVKNAFNME
jgi:hypothetical protein